MLGDYTIPFFGLKEDIHTYDFEVDDTFFEFFDNPDLPGGSLKIALSLSRKQSFLELDFHFKGFLSLVCDRCLDNFKYPIDFKQKLFVRFGNENDEQSDNVIIIPRNETRLNVAQFIYEYAALNIPVKKVHPEDKNSKSLCNQEMIKKLKQHQGTAENEDDSDPRWQILKNLKNNN
ncbi:MAG: DUF177 domain-containing protein [Bacteroidales bacterium]|nr:DUF177 domain-containing protein [Bacteroidales bacterium]